MCVCVCVCVCVFAEPGQCVGVVVILFEDCGSCSQCNSDECTPRSQIHKVPTFSYEFGFLRRTLAAAWSMVATEMEAEAELHRFVIRCLRIQRVCADSPNETNETRVCTRKTWRNRRSRRLFEVSRDVFRFALPSS